jgi:hypothetical protein
MDKLLFFRLFLAAIVVLAGLSLAATDLASGPKIFGAIGTFTTGLSTAGLILFGRSFLTESPCGVIAIVVMGISGFCSFAFEQRGMNFELASASYEVAIVLAMDDATCKIPSRSVSFQRAAIACGVQSTSDLSAAALEGAKLAYIPVEIDFIDKAS